MFNFRLMSFARAWRFAKLSWIIGIFFCTPSFAADYKILMLEQPIINTGKFTVPAAIALLGGSAVLDVVKVAGIYQLTNSAAWATAEALRNVAVTAVTYPLATESIAHFFSMLKTDQRLQELIKIPGIKGFKVLTVGSTIHQTTTAERQTRSFVFALVDSHTTIDTKIAGHWFEIEHPETTNLVLDLQIGGLSAGDKISIPMIDVLDGAALEASIREQWVSHINEWLGSLRGIPGFWDRYVTHHSVIQNLAINCTLDMNGTLKNFGSLVEGVGVPEFLGMGLAKKARRWLESIMAYQGATPPAAVVFLLDSKEVGNNGYFNACTKLSTGLKESSRLVF